ncbi:MAG: MFS transporter [Acidimicrobiia bacterium]
MSQTDWDERDRRDEALGIDGSGVDEFAVLAWPMLLRRRIAQRVGISHNTAVLVIVLSGLFTVAFTITALSNSLDSIAADIGSTRSTLLWTITGPMLAFGVVGPAFGKAGDLWGHRRLFVFGLLGAGIFAALTAMAWSAASLIAFRTLSATCGSATGPATMAYINQLFAPEERVRPLGFWSFANAGAPVIGVVAGAPLIEAFGWRILFAIQAPLCLIGVVFALWLLPETRKGTKARFDVAGAVTLGLGASLLLFAVNRGNDWGWTSPRVLGCLAASFVVVAFFVRAERRATEPLLPMSWLRRRNIVAPIASQTLSNFAYMGSFFLTPALLQNGLGYSESTSGLMLIARPLTFAIAAPLGSMVTVRVGERVSGTVGTAVVAISMMVFSVIGAGDGFLVIVALALAGFGLGVAAPAMVATVANAVEDIELGVAGAVQQLMTQLGAVLGAEVMQSVQLATESSGLVASFNNAFMVAAGVGAIGVGFATLVRSTPREVQPAEGAALV